MTHEATSSHYLLPNGLRDLLPPEAGYQMHMLSTLLQQFERAGYAQVMPPLAEFEQTLLAEKAKTLETSTFRMMDPLSGQMLAIRSDMTTQVARIAASRLSSDPLPLRLSYSGNVLRTGTDGLTAERQFTQAGIELIGSDHATADAEVIQVILGALETLGFSGLVVDLSVAGLLDALLAQEVTAFDRDQIIAALRHKDSAALPDTLGCHAVLVGLLEASGSLDSVRKATSKLSFAAPAKALMQKLFDVAELLTSIHGVGLTLDPLEYHGLDYHQGVCFSIFHTGSRQEVGRGGRYSLSLQGITQGATGATLYVGKLLGSYRAPPPPMRVYIPVEFGFAAARSLREAGAITLCGTHPVADCHAEAARLGCTHVYSDETLQPLKQGNIIL